MVHDQNGLHTQPTRHAGLPHRGTIAPDLGPSHRLRGDVRAAQRQGGVLWHGEHRLSTFLPIPELRRTKQDSRTVRRPNIASGQV